MQISVNNLTFFPEYIHGISIKFEISVSFQKFQNSNPDLFCYDFQQNTETERAALSSERALFE